MTCTCGNPDDHVIARRVTADGKHVLAWDDGTLTWALGYAIRGSASPRTPEGRERARRAAWLVLDDVCLFDADEVPALIRAARWAAERGTGRAGMWERLRGPKRGRVAGMAPQWTTLQADRDGRPTVRVWQLPRLAYPGLAVWHERGRYDVVSEVQRGTGTYASTGHSARTLRELGELLPTLRNVTTPETDR